MEENLKKLDFDILCEGYSNNCPNPGEVALYFETCCGRVAVLCDECAPSVLYAFESSYGLTTIKDNYCGNRIIKKPKVRRLDEKPNV